MTKSLYGLIAIALVGFFVTTGCDPNTLNPTPGTAPMFSDVNATNSFDVLESSFVITDATLDQDMHIMYGEGDERGRGGRGRGPGGRGPGDRSDSARPRSDSAHPHPYARLLTALNLTEEQRPAVAALLQAHKDCITAALEVHRAAMDALLSEAKAQRESIKAQLDAGEITREEARAALRRLNARVREAIKNSGVREEVRAMMKNCDDEFIAGLSQILTEEQKAILDRWLASRPARRG